MTKSQLNIKDIGSYLEKMAENSESVYWLSSPDFKQIVYISPSYEKIWGRSREELYKNPEIWITHLHPEDVANHHPIHSMAEKVAELGSEARYEENYRIIRPDGETRWIIDRGFPVYDDNGNCCGVTGVAVDVTKEKQHEAALKEAKDRAEAANRSKSEFLAAVNHELRTPLTGIIGMALILASEPLAPEHAKQVTDIISSSNHLLSLVNDLLDIAKLEAGKIEINPVPIDLRNLIEETALMLTSQANSKGIELRVNYQAEIPHLVLGDSRAIRQVLLNLVGNAIKFTHEGFVEIQVACLEQQEQKAKLQISVNDSGIGIPSDKLETVFERFSQLDNSRTRKYGGTGLGLSITKLYVEVMGGEIGVTSRLGQGSSFFFVLNFPLQTQSRLESTWEPYKAKVRILVVDDSLHGEVIRKHIGSPLCQLSTGKDALNTLLNAQQHNQAFDIVIVDEKLRTTSAFEIAKDIYRHPNLKKPMMLLVSRAKKMPEKELAKANHFFDCISKPTHPTELLVALTVNWQKWEERLITLQTIEPVSENDNPFKILLVEDDPIIQKVHGIMLKKIGCKVDIADNGEKALALYANGYDMIFMDIGLGEVSGTEIAAEIRKQENGKHHIPIIAMTGYGDEDSKQACINAGIDEIIIKPTTPEKLQELVERYRSQVEFTV